jgi:hypothetical protein
MHPRALLLGSLTFGLTLTAHALDPNEKDPRKIAEAVENRPSGDRGTMLTTLTLEDASGRQRVRKLRQQALDFPGGTKTLMFFESPADVRNTGLLSIDYDDGHKDDDQWLYLPSQHKSTRISSADKSGSFMGTDITYADMTKKDIDDYDYSVIEQSVKVGDEDCWLIEARPRTEQEKRETGYLKTHTWISKSKLMPMQVKAWVIEGKKLKYMKFTELKQVDGIWVAGKLAVRTMRGDELESQTTMQMQEVKFNQPTVTEDQFSERRLEQGL